MQLLEETSKHINDYALIGLRTLAVAKRDLTEAEYQRFVSDHQAASQAMSDRERMTLGNSHEHGVLADFSWLLLLLHVLLVRSLARSI